MIVAEENRLEHAARRLQREIRGHIDYLRKRLKHLDRDIDGAVRGSELWRQKDDLLDSVPGVGVPRITQMKPQARAISPLRAENPQRPDSLAERGEFELPVPICEQSDDSIRLSFATSRRTAKRYRPAAHF
jgi:hypothetical protein